MPGNINWAVSFTGLDESIVKLTRLNKLIDDVSRKGAAININTSGTGNNRIIGANVNSGGTAAASATAGAVIGESVLAGNIIGKKASDVIQQVFHHAGKTWNVTSPKPGTTKIAPAVISFYHNGKILRREYPEETRPPGLRKGQIVNPQGILDNLHNYFNEYRHLDRKEKGARGRSFLSGIGKGIGGETGGSIAGIAGEGLAALGIELGPLGLAIAAVVGAFIALKKVSEQLEQGIKDGAQAYQQAAKLGHSVASTFAFQFAAGAVGAGDIDISALKAQQEKYNPSKGMADITPDFILATARAGELGNAQQLLNLAEDFKAVMADSANNARQIANSGKELQQVSESGLELAREWKTMWVQIAAIAGPAIIEVEKFFKYIFEGINKMLENILNRLQQLFPGIFKKGGLENFQQFQLNKVSPNSTSYEKLGFVYKNAASDNPQQVIAKNTLQTVQELKTQSSILKTIANLMVIAPITGATLPALI